MRWGGGLSGGEGGSSGSISADFCFPVAFRCRRSPSPGSGLVPVPGRLGGDGGGGGGELGTAPHLVTHLFRGLQPCPLPKPSTAKTGCPCRGAAGTGRAVTRGGDTDSIADGGPPSPGLPPVSPPQQHNAPSTPLHPPTHPPRDPPSGARPLPAQQGHPLSFFPGDIATMRPKGGGWSSPAIPSPTCGVSLWGLSGVAGGGGGTPIPLPHPRRRL